MAEDAASRLNSSSMGFLLSLDFRSSPGDALRGLRVLDCDIVRRARGFLIAIPWLGDGLAMRGGFGAVERCIGFGDLAMNKSEAEMVFLPVVGEGCFRGLRFWLGAEARECSETLAMVKR